MNFVEVIQSIFVLTVFLGCLFILVVSAISLYQLSQGGIRVSEFDLRTGNLPSVDEGDTVEFVSGRRGVVLKHSSHLVSVLTDPLDLKGPLKEIHIMTTQEFWKSVNVMKGEKVHFTGWIP